MKRTSSGPSDSRRRKSARLAAARTVNSPLAEVSVDHDKYCNSDLLSLQDLSRYCSVYNAWLPFAKNHEDALSKSPVVESGRAFQDNVSEIEEIIEDAKRKIKSKYAQTLQNLCQFERSIPLHFDEWYKGGNIFDLPAAQFRDVMKHEAHIKNIKDFLLYLYRIFGDALEKPPYDDELHPEGDEHELPNPSLHLTFVGKVFIIVQTLINRKCSFGPLPLLVVLKSLHNYRHPRIKFDELRTTHKNIDSIIRAYVTGEPPPPPIRNTDHPHTLCPSLEWTADPEKAKKSTWHFESTARALGGAYREDLENEYCKTNHEKRHCFHMLSVDLLEWLQQKAWSEKRYHVFLAVGTLLPAELAERIFEFTLAAEKLPCDPLTKVRSKLGSDRDTAEERGVPCQNCGLPHHNDNIKESFQCSHMKDKCLNSAGVQTPDDSDSSSDSDSSNDEEGDEGETSDHMSNDT